MAADPRIGNQFLNPGLGYGGSCFPKDVSSLYYQARQAGYDPEILPAVMDVNDDRASVVYIKLLRIFNGNLAGKCITVLGGAFKPDTDDVRESPAIGLIYKLLSAGATVTVYDPKAMDNLKEVFKSHMVLFAPDPYVAADGADAVVLVTEWSEFTKMSMGTIKERMTGARVFMDCRNALSPYVMEDLGFNYYCIGNGDSVTKEQV
jgi:UDPglucose 6-dehydrogenase